MENIVTLFVRFKSKIVYIVFKDSVSPSQRRQFASVAKTNQLMLHSEMMAVCSEITQNTKIHSMNRSIFRTFKGAAVP